MEHLPFPFHLPLSVFDCVFHTLVCTLFLIADRAASKIKKNNKRWVLLCRQCMTNTLQLGERARNLGWRLNLPRQKNSERSENQKTGRASMEVAKAPSDRGMPKLARFQRVSPGSTKNSSRSKQQRNDCNELYLFLTEILKNIKIQFHFVLFKL